MALWLFQKLSGFDKADIMAMNEAVAVFLCFWWGTFIVALLVVGAMALATVAFVAAQVF